MARDFEDHCWKDIVDDEILEIYEPYRREVHVGRNPAVLAIDLYNKAYQGGSRPLREVNRRYPGSCGENAWKAIEPTRALLAAARKAGLPVIYTTRHADTDGVRSTHRRMGKEAEELYHIKEELTPLPGELVIYKERASGFFGTAADRASAQDRRGQSDHLRREHVGLRARQHGRCLFLRLPLRRGRRMHL